MEGSIIILLITCLSMILCFLFKPQFHIGKLLVNSYWIVVFLGALATIIFRKVDLSFLLSSLLTDSSINPLKILVLFVCMTILSIFLDEVGFFRYLANLTLKRANGNQLKLFITLYIVVSILTVFTSNDIIVLTFTPFICYFSKNAKINPLPYLVSQFVSANTMSMMLIIGNPTNIYIASAYNVNFVQYLKVMFLPTFLSSIVAFFMLFLVFRKQLKVKATPRMEKVKIKSKPLLIIGLVHLLVCTLALAIGPYFNLDMWIVSLVSAISLFIFVAIFSLIKGRKPTELYRCFKRAPWELIPFVLSMFVIILALNNNGVTKEIGLLLGSDNTIIRYGITSFLSANVINNIPMSVLFCPIMQGLSGKALQGAIYATIVGSNLGALLTPLGALAGIMWSKMLKLYDVKLSYAKFIKYGVIVSIPALIINLAVLFIIL